MTEQEMFNKAVLGLASQNWEPAMEGVSMCRYLTDDGKRCAWGHVDPEGTRTADGIGSVGDLHKAGVGLAAELTGPGLRFAQDLQATHDNAALTGCSLKVQFEGFADARQLTWPEDA